MSTASPFKTKTSREPKEILEAQITAIQGDAQDRIDVLRLAFKACESPLEQVFLLEYIDLYGAEPAWDPGGSPCFSHELLASEHRSYQCWVFIDPQRVIETPDRKMRVDFLITIRGYVERKHRTIAEIVVEIDGHDFHERTKEQAARDRSRDRLLTAAGYKVLRFTGSEVYRDPLSVLFELSGFINEASHV